MNAYLQSVAACFGLSKLDFELDEDSRKRIVLVSILPTVVFAATLIQVSLQIKFAGSMLSEMPEFWRRVEAISNLAPALVPLAVAVVFASGLRPWSRAEGSWMFLIGAVLAAVSLGLLLSAVVMHALLGREDAHLLRADTWAFVGYVPGFLAVGYFFVAYRSMPTGQVSDAPS